MSGRLATSTNEYGVAVAHFRCVTCGVEFSVTPAPASDKGWENCTAPECLSYDPDRDIDKWFENGGRVRSIPNADGSRRLVPYRVIEGGLS